MNAWGSGHRYQLGTGYVRQPDPAAEHEDAILARRMADTCNGIQRIRLVKVVDVWCGPRAIGDVVEHEADLWTPRRRAVAAAYAALLQQNPGEYAYEWVESA